LKTKFTVANKLQSKMLLEAELSTNVSKILKKDISEQFSKLQTKNPVIYFFKYFSLEGLSDAIQIQKKHFCIISQKIFQNQLTNELYLPYGLSDS
jgi:hypothetical protein